MVLRPKRVDEKLPLVLLSVPTELWSQVLLSVPNRGVIPTEAKWRDLLFIIRRIKSQSKRRPPLCHPDRSVAQWRDLQFNGPLLEMFSTHRGHAGVCATVYSLSFQ